MSDVAVMNGAILAPPRRSSARWPVAIRLHLGDRKLATTTYAYRADPETRDGAPRRPEAAASRETGAAAGGRTARAHLAQRDVPAVRPPEAFPHVHRPGDRRRSRR